ncbi:methylmalonyl-CoA epimerase [Scopulibacillus darangshiensis]|uniref:Methylmalonyl-CoA epimerase n=1 Tax=Scopulibacillus darangshiensis TaxID=442528 RepID=A0A4R2NIG5_9BACL|nr:VOC family protein [Scopulibacillus darangshiensis]TCP21052.1 methylmalonyl-CoA epimerase [Scopulibacillus darangshiensis]
MKLDHIGIDVIDLEKAITFYGNALGFTLKRRMTIDTEKIAFLSDGQTTIELCCDYDRESSLSSHIAFEVASLDILRRDLAKQGMEADEVFTVKRWQSAFYKGPNGEMLEFIQIK